MKGETTMEIITKDELMQKLNLTEEDLATVAGGSFAECKAECDEKEIMEMNSCNAAFPDDDKARDECIMGLFELHRRCVLDCEKCS